MTTVRPKLRKPLYTRESLRRKPVLTVGEVALLCGVAPRTVSMRWFDTGLMKGYRIPGSQDRRVYRVDLIRFAHEHGMTEVMNFLTRTPRIVAIGAEDAPLQMLAAALPDLMVVDAGNLFAVRAELQAGAVVVLIDLSMGGPAVRAAFAEVHRLTPRPSMVILTYESTTDSEVSDLPGIAVECRQPWLDLAAVVANVLEGK